MMAEITTYSMDLARIVLTEIMYFQHQVFKRTVCCILQFVSSTQPIRVHFVYNYVAS